MVARHPPLASIELVGPRVPYAWPSGVPGLIRAVSSVNGDRTAAVDARGSYTYRTLEFASDRIAAALTGLHLAERSIVLVCLPRSRVMLAALLGVLKAGLAYLPVAADEPPARRATIVRTAQPAAAIIEETEAGLDLPAGIPRISAARLAAVSIDDVPPGWQPAPLRQVDDDLPAYVLFTSGSTGEPKGVVVGSAALCNRLLWMRDAYGFNPDDRILQKTPYTFDVSAWEIFAPLISGSCCVLAAAGAEQDPGQLIGTIADHQVTVCHFVPSMLEEFLRWPGVERCRSLRLVVCSGEALPPALARRFVQALPAQLHNLYGPTEAAIDVTWWACPSDPAQIDRILIGNPIANCTLLVLDGEGRPVPKGAPGELYIGGLPLAAGYLRRPDLTARAFVMAPAWCSVDRLYRSGDMVRVVEGGIEYLGRIDEQVKIRGHRIEPQEVQHRLQEHPAVAEAAVVAAGEGADTRLQAFLVLNPGPSLDPKLEHDLRRHLALALPSAFMPTAFSQLAAMPHTSSGKQDRGRLRELASFHRPVAPEPDRSLSTAPPGEPAAELETLWCEALRLARADPDASFIDAGGHSLAAARLAGALLDRWGLEIPIAAFLTQNLTLRELIAQVGDRPRRAAPQSPARAETDGAPLLPDQRRLWLWKRIFPDCPAYNSASALEIHAAIDERTLWAAVRDLVQRHEILRTTFAAGDEGGEPRQRVFPEADLAIVVRATPEGLDADAVRQFCDEIASTVFDPARLPLFRIGVMTSSSQARSVLVAALEHLIADQEGLDTFWRDLDELYRARLEGRPRRLPAMPSQVADLAALPVAGDAPGRRADLDFWRAHLAGAPQRLELPFSRRRPELPSFEGAAVERSLDRAAALRLDRFARAGGLTPAVVFLTAFATALQAWSGESEVMVGVPVSGRGHDATQDLVGSFVKTLPLRLALPAEGNPRAALRKVQGELVTAFEHSSAPFEEILEAMRTERDPQRNPLFQVWFNDLTRARPPRAFAGHPARPLPIPVSWSLFDLGLYLWRNEDEGYRLELRYSSGVFTPAPMAELLRQCALHVERLMAGRPALAAPSSAAALPRPAPRATRVDVRDLVRDIELHGERSPDLPALATGPGTVTYGDLVRDMAWTAGRVQRLTPAAGAVAIAAERTPRLASAILGCWQAGRTALLLDGSSPESWNEAAGRRLGATAWIRLDAAGTLQVSPSRSLPDPLPQPARERRADAWISHALATSGTTGAPAVVLLPSDALPEALGWYTQELGLTAADQFCFTVSPAHDPMLRDLILPLWIGASVYVPSRPEMEAPQRFLETLERVGATVLNLTPSRANLLLAGTPPSITLPQLHRIVSYGEALTDSLARRLQVLAPAAQIFNLYGTTETPQASSMHRWRDPATSEDDWPSARRSVPIGLGTPYRGLTVLTAAGGPALPGEVGELLVSGRGLAIGYAGGDGRQLRLEPDPTRDDSRPAFHTGDRARVTLDGEVEILGRTDRQVTVSGYRIELEGVERVLGDVPGVRLAAVAADAPGGPIAAWIVAEPGRRVVEGDVTRQLRALLPEWAVPARVHVVDQIPVDRNGKVDVETLRRSRTAPSRGPVDRRTEALARLVLEAARRSLPDPAAIQPETSFFEAGLTSLSLLRLHAFLARELELELPVTDVFRFPSAGALARHLAEGDTAPGPFDATATKGSEAEARRGLRRALSGKRD